MATRCGPSRSEDLTLCIAWFVIWFICNLIGGDEPLKLDPLNGWTATLILTAALDINRPQWGPGRAR